MTKARTVKVEHIINGTLNTPENRKGKREDENNGSQMRDKQNRKKTNKERIKTENETLKNMNETKKNFPIKKQ